MRIEFKIIITTLSFVLIPISHSLSQINYSPNLTDKKFSIDHVNIAVNDLSKTKLTFEKLGFTIKPGRIHKNSINNLHMKFVNGTSLELITSKEPIDDLSSEYLKLIKKGEGGAFIALQSYSFISNHSIEIEQKFPVRIKDTEHYKSIVFDENHPLRPIWFVEAGTVKDSLTITTHKNTSEKIIGVWISYQITDDMIDLFTLLKCKIAPTDFPMKDSIKISLTEGEIYLVNLPINKIGRPIVGVTIEVEEIATTRECLNEQNVAFAEISNESAKSLIIPSSFTQNILIEFREINDN